ncbi:MAG TPA: dual specificity protein phosphatase [bacterium]|nr:dual specificity protein phosphatase [bacterium]
MEIFEILENQLYQSGAPEEAADWRPILERSIDVVVDLYGTLDPGVPTIPNSILYIFWPIEDIARLPDMKIMDALTDLAVRSIRDGHRVLVHCHKGKSRSGLFNALVAMKILHIDGKAAVDLIRQRRPGALGNQVFAGYLEQLPAPPPDAPPQS